MDFEKQITKYWTDFPGVWSFLGSPEEAEQISIEHKDQIHFLDKDGTKFLNDYLDASKMTKYLPYDPFKDYFRNIELFQITEDCDDTIKKWLYDKEIPFAKYVFVNNNRSGHAIMLTWKMVIKYWQGLFFSEDLVVFDASMNWGLFYYHESTLYFGTQVNFDREAEAQRAITLNTLLKNYR